MSTLNYDYFYEWVLKNLNINLNAYKEKQLQRRIGTIMKQSGAATLEEYAKIISLDATMKKQFLDYITINVTEFFRNKDLFENFELMVNTHLSTKFNDLKIWSAACSIGAEPYSLAIIMEKNNIKLKQKILATDIDLTILDRAKKGYFRENELKNVSIVDKTNYFDFKDGYFMLQNSIKSKVQFKQHDLVQDKFDTGFHVIVCRNVTIYFKSDIKDVIYKKMADSLLTGGLLFTGATETIYQPEKYGLRKIASFIYEKIE